MIPKSPKSPWSRNKDKDIEAIAWEPPEQPKRRRSDEDNHIGRRVPNNE